jgi:hypothetical protein
MHFLRHGSHSACAAEADRVMLLWEVITSYCLLREQYEVHKYSLLDKLQGFLNDELDCRDSTHSVLTLKRRYMDGRTASVV